MTSLLSRWAADHCWAMKLLQVDREVGQNIFLIETDMKNMSHVVLLDDTITNKNSAIYTVVYDFFPSEISLQNGGGVGVGGV